MDAVISVLRKLQMKTIWKRILTVILCAAIAASGLCTGTAYASGKKPPLSVTFDGKSVDLVRVLEDGDEESASIGEVVEILGEPDEKEKLDKFYTSYLWENGKSGISFAHYVNEDLDILCHFGVTLKGKKDALCGIKTGMKKKTVLRKMKKKYGKNNVGTAKEGQALWKKNGKFVAKGKPTGDGEYITVYAYSYVLPLNFDLKDGRVVSMGFSS